MSQALSLFVAIVIIVAVVYVAVAILANPITANLAQVEQAKAQQERERAVQERERTEQVRVAESEGTERFQTFALTLAGLVAMGKSGDIMMALFVAGLWALAGYALYQYAKGRL